MQNDLVWCPQPISIVHSAPISDMTMLQELTSFTQVTSQKASVTLQRARTIDRMSGTSGGSNILRGGKRSYDCKTLVGNFVEEAYRPNAISSSWSGGVRYETTAKAQMQDGVGIKTTLFGAGLKRDDDVHYDYTQLINADKTSGAATWSSLTQSAYNNSSKPTEFAAPREMRGRRMSANELQDYRQRWSHENEDMTKMRYVTETTTTTDKLVKPHFRKELIKLTQVSFK